MCRPYTFLPSLDHTAQNSQQWVTPELGINSTQVNEFLTRMMYLRQQEKTQSQVPNQTNNLQPLIPHMFVPPQKVCPLFAQQSLGCPTSFPGLQQQARQEVSEPYSCSLAPSGNQFPTILSPRENCSRASQSSSSISHGPDNPLL
jgi:hypothetical protein